MKAMSSRSQLYRLFKLYMIHLGARPVTYKDGEIGYSCGGKFIFVTSGSSLIVHHDFVESAMAMFGMDYETLAALVRIWWRREGFGTHIDYISMGGRHFV